MDSAFVKIRNFLHERGEQGWTRRTAIRTLLDGKIAYCLTGLIYFIGNDGRDDFRGVDTQRRVRTMLNRVLFERLGGSACPHIGIEAANDCQSTTYQDILTTIERLAAEDEEHIVPAAPAPSIEQVPAPVAKAEGARCANERIAQ